MNISGLLKKMQEEKTLSLKQHDYLLDIHQNKLFSIYRELSFLFYAGILFVLAGIGLTIKQYFTQLGDIAVIGSLTAGALTAFTYCFARGNSYSPEEAASPVISFDYILFFGCALYSMDIAYIETQFHVLGDLWDSYLLISAALFFFLAYRYDNRLVLSLALSTLAAWFGFTFAVNRFSFLEYHRLYAIAYGLLTLLLGILLYRLKIKKHFLDIYLNFAVHFIFIALISGVIHYKLFSLYFLCFLAACAFLVFYSLQTKKFLYMLFAIIYGYIGLSVVLLQSIIRDTFFILSYFIVTSFIVVVLIFVLSRKFKENK